MQEPGLINFEMETGGKLREWPSRNDYIVLKEKSLEKHTPIFKAMIKDDENFINSDDKELNDASELLSNFVFGIEMAYRRFGWDIREMPIELVPGGLKSDFCVLERSTVGGLRREYAIDTYKLKKNLWQYGKSDRRRGGGGMRNVTMEDLFEIGGVEEAAHYIFRQEKRYRKNKEKGPITLSRSLNDLDVSLHNSDIERRALLWKIQYTERYKPEYTQVLKELEEKVTQVRLNDREMKL